MFVIKIANGQLFSQMFKTMNMSMYDYLSNDKKIDPIFLDYFKIKEINFTNCCFHYAL